MATKLKPLKNQSGEVDTYLFFCPGCKETHPFQVPRWSFNGDMEKPTFSPSLLVYESGRNRAENQAPSRKTQCHLFLTDGVIQYCGDCPHELAGKSIECPDWRDEMW